MPPPPHNIIIIIVMENIKFHQHTQLLLEVLMIILENLSEPPGDTEYNSSLSESPSPVASQLPKGAPPMISVGFGSSSFRIRESSSNVLKMVLCKQLK